MEHHTTYTDQQSITREPCLPSREQCNDSMTWIGREFLIKFSAREGESIEELRKRIALGFMHICVRRYRKDSNCLRMTGTFAHHIPHFDYRETSDSCANEMKGLQEFVLVEDSHPIEQNMGPHLHLYLRYGRPVLVSKRKFCCIEDNPENIMIRSWRKAQGSGNVFADRTLIIGEYHCHDLVQEIFREASEDVILDFLRMCRHHLIDPMELIKVETYRSILSDRQLWNQLAIELIQDDVKELYEESCEEGCSCECSCCESQHETGECCTRTSCSCSCNCCSISSSNCSCDCCTTSNCSCSCECCSTSKGDCCGCECCKSGRSSKCKCSCECCTTSRCACSCSCCSSSSSSSVQAMQCTCECSGYRNSGSHSKQSSRSCSSSMTTCCDGGSCQCTCYCCGQSRFKNMKQPSSCSTTKCY